MEPTPEQIKEELDLLNTTLEARGVDRQYAVAAGQFARLFLVSIVPDQFPSHLSQPYGARGILTVIRMLTIQLK